MRAWRHDAAASPTDRAADRLGGVAVAAPDARDVWPDRYSAGMGIEELLGYAGPVIYVSLAAAALYGLFCAVLLFLRISQKKFSSEAEAQEFLDEVRERLARHDYDGAAEFCDQPQYWAKAVPQLVMVTLANRDRSPATLRRMISEKFDREIMADLSYRHSWIGTIVKSAPMLGLLGTVTGMIGAFAKIASSQSAGTDPSGLAADISFALFTTAAGLAVAIPLVLLGAAVRVRMGRLEDTVQEHLSEFLDDFELAQASR